MAKVARVQISKEYFEMILRADFWARPNQTITTNAPKDLEILGLAYPKSHSGYPHTLEIFVKSETFTDVPEGNEPPLIDAFVYTVKTENG